MSTIQNLKNFIRHGKQARDAKSPADQAVSNVHAQQQRFNDQGRQQPIQAPQPVHYGISEPNAHDHKPLKAHPEPQAGYSAAAVDNRNVAAKAGHAAAHAADGHQKNANKADKQKQIDQEVLERIVAEEREAKGKLPRYPGLDRYQLIEKMGDGAFSNVYRARDLKGIYSEVAVKVVRKFEMNATQVSPLKRHPPPFPIPFPSHGPGICKPVILSSSSLSLISAQPCQTSNMEPMPTIDLG